jgi:hypothetical protein
MMNMRPFQIIILVVFAVLAVGGLFVFATYKGFGGSTPVGEVSIWGTLPAAAMTETVNDLRTNHQEFGKVTYSEHSEATFDTELANAIASGNGPDLIVLNQEHLLSLRSKLTVIPTATISERTHSDRDPGPCVDRDHACVFLLRRMVAVVAVVSPRPFTDGRGVVAVWSRWSRSLARRAVAADGPSRLSPSSPPEHLTGTRCSRTRQVPSPGSTAGSNRKKTRTG